MRYFVEIKTLTPNGKDVTFRRSVDGNTEDDAVIQAWEMFQAAIETDADQYSEPFPKLREFGQPYEFVNHYGGISRIVSICYGDQAQVTEGIFEL